MEHKRHPLNPRSNITKIGTFREDSYALERVPPTVVTHEDLLPGRAPKLTQATIGKYLLPLTKELDEVPPRPTFAELPDSVKDRMVLRDKAFWVDKPGANAYTLHDAADQYQMNTEMVLPPHQDVFPRSYQYDLDCIKYRRQHACDGLLKKSSNKPLPPPHCRDCNKWDAPSATPQQVYRTGESGALRWRYYPDVQTTIPREQLRQQMTEVGRPFRNEACAWYNKHYPSAPQNNLIIRKFSK